MVNFVDSLNACQIDKQKAYLKEAQEALELGPADMAKLLDTNYNTYKAWLYGVNPMPGIGYLALDCLLKRKKEGLTGSAV